MGLSSQLTANTVPKLIFEKNMNDIIQTTQGSAIELYKIKGFCELKLKLYAETGQEERVLKFKGKQLYSVQIFNYFYNENMFFNNEKEDVDKSSSLDDSIVLQSHEKISGKKIVKYKKDFSLYRKYISEKILRESCN